MEVTDDDIRAIDEAFQRILEFGISLETKETNAVWFANLLTCLLDSTIRECRHLKIGLKKYTGLEAWACRNLLELNIFTQYILISETEARRFIGDRLIDGIQIFKSFQDWLQRFDPEAETTPLKETLRIAREQMTAEGINSGRHLSTRELAAKLGLTEEYTHMNTVCFQPQCLNATAACGICRKYSAPSALAVVNDSQPGALPLAFTSRPFGALNIKRNPRGSCYRLTNERIANRVL